MEKVFREFTDLLSPSLLKITLCQHLHLHEHENKFRELSIYEPPHGKTNNVVFEQV